MKFLENSPHLPEALIESVNEGDVVFLCGAGVSLGGGLPSFQALTDQVYNNLGESRENEAAERVAYERKEYDRVLRSLERRTLLPRTESRIRAEVAAILAPPLEPDLSRHLSLLHLSRDSAGRPRLLTTNFDTLFERAARQAEIPFLSHAGKSIPRPGAPRDHGILHLHGRLEDRELNLDGSDLILTSADFGDAYLRDGWASQYIEDRMRLNTIVLVGYGAEDAALRLLLETLDADRDRFRDLKKIYAFEKQTNDSASLWKAKGIDPVEFSEHEAIYDNLAEWARYAQNPESYRRARVQEILRSPR
jgi:hypothetical protein